MTPRAVLRLAAAAPLLLLCLVGWIVSRPFGGQGFWAALFLRGAGWLVGLRVRCEGQRLRGPVLIAANHISWLDILALGGSARARFIAKSEIARWPVVGTLASMAGAVFVSRDRRSATRTQADAVAAALRDPRPLVLFAEGGTGDGLAVDPFRPALFASANEAVVPVQPVAIDYGPGRARLAWPDGVGFGEEAKKMLNRRERVPVTLRFLKPLDPALLDRKQVAAQAHAAVAGALS